MKITVLVDNNTIIDRYLYGEPGASFFIEDCGKRILFDVGYSDIFIKNAHKLNINLYDTDFIAISHGHNDHTWGLVPMVRLCSEAPAENFKSKKPVLLAHTQTFKSKYHGTEMIGSILTEDVLRDYFEMKLTDKPFWITENLVFLGEIERTNSFENKEPIGKFMNNGAKEDDFLRDDTALAYKSGAGLVIITGCSHSGICNIVEHAKKICNENRVADIIGGLHLLNPDKEKMELTKEYLKQSNIKKLHACHCTDLHSKIELSEAVEIGEVGAGLTLEYK
ncbi:MAG TPA: MBL fold metallo-hydrolase [Bacillota bacterium]|nr:MBL fold metallo-hydrolase [Bacillota bacterium]